MKAYDEDLAYVHDAGFGDLARSAAPFLLATLRKHGIGDGLIVDLGCGTGLLAERLSRAGYGVLGVDISPAMLALARKRAPAVEFRAASLFDVDIPPCHAVTAIGECLNYRFDPASGKPALIRLFRRIHAALEPGGIFVFDLAGPGRHGPVPERKYHVERDWALLFQVSEAKNELTRQITLFRRQGDSYRRSDETHHLRLYDPAEIVVELTRLGFKVRSFRRYGTFPLPPTHFGLEATKPKPRRLLTSVF